MTTLGSASLIERGLRALRGWIHPPGRQGGGPSARLDVIGHRGAARHAAENTIAAFQAAVALGAGAVEADVCLTRDGELVLWHDEDPDSPAAALRQSGAEGLAFVPVAPARGSAARSPVGRLPYEVFRDRHGYAPRPPDGVAVEGLVPSVPAARLDELLRWAAREPRVEAIYLDLKLTPEQRGGARLVLDRLALACERHPRLAAVRLAVLSGAREVCEALVAEARRAVLPVHIPELRVTCDFELPGALDGAHALGLADVAVGCTPRRAWADVYAEICELCAARDAGALRSVTAWTVDDPARIARLVEAGIDGIVTNDPVLCDAVWRAARGGGTRAAVSVERCS